MFIKIIGIILIITSCSAWGYSVKYKHTMRISELENILTCLDVLGKEICFNMLNITDAFKIVTDYATNYNADIFEKAIKQLEKSDGETISLIWNNVLDEIKSEKTLYEDRDIAVLKKFGNLLGSGDLQLQKENIEVLKNSLEELIISAKGKSDKVFLAPKIGAYTGVAISIILL